MVMLLQLNQIEAHITHMIPIHRAEYEYIIPQQQSITTGLRITKKTTNMRHTIQF